MPLVGVPVYRDRIDECLVVRLMFAGGDGGRLAVSFRDEFRRSYIRHPYLDGAKPLSAQPLAMFTDSLSCIGHAPMLHVTALDAIEFVDLNRPQQQRRVDADDAVEGDERADGFGNLQPNQRRLGQLLTSDSSRSR